MEKIEFEESEFFFYLPEDWIVLPEEEAGENQISVSSSINDVGAMTIHVPMEIDSGTIVDLESIMNMTAQVQEKYHYGLNAG